MHEHELRRLLEDFAKGTTPLEEVVNRLRGLQGDNLGFACLDHHRLLRTGIPEAVFGEGKSVEQLCAILEKMLARPVVTLATRVAPDKAAAVRERLPALTYHADARMLLGNEQHIPRVHCHGTVLVVSAGTSDLPVAEEACQTLRCLGHPVETLYDVGVAGLHRLLAHQELLAGAAAIIVVAGMEGALPSVVAGITPAPVVGVPVSIGYGAGIGGFAALFGMLNSCAPGLAVVNIDNGFGAACMAAAINLKSDE
ncbi:MAG: 1-(5-phosphoribosyl)-5-amino-4-imidazole-carboxylate carboxylase [Desulfobulbaceae bacterium A2]|nr:MAG: 1-(5-phosphoribosyl)-5-amino-4-imidazole-carboxylate carboxylase [Desulfobulbaceae bacterium A2]